MEFSFTRYLAAKKSVDDRALNTGVWAAAAQAVTALQEPVRQTPLQVLDLGCGIGVMLERLLAGGLLRQADYSGIDHDPANIAAAGPRLQRWAAAQQPAWQAQPEAGGLRLERPGQFVTARFQAADLYDLLAGGATGVDFLVAHAFLDLFDLPRILPGILRLLRPGGVFYFTLNFDGETIFEPALDPALDTQIIQLYHRSMDERQINGQPSGDSRSGRHLFSLLQASGAQILAAGASDWVVFGGPHGYPQDEAYFLQHILHFVEQTLAGHPELEPARFAAWLAARRAQIERGELVYIAHQLDFAGRRPVMP